MKKIISILLIIATICTFCGGCTQEVTAPEMETPNINNVESMVVSHKSTISFNTVVDSESFVTYLNSLFDNLDFKSMDVMTDYFDDYFNMHIDEYARIIGTDEESFDLIEISVSFVNNKIVDISFSLNVPNDSDFYRYQSELEELGFNIGLNFDLTEGQLVQLNDEIFNFENYRDNVYGNKEIYFTLGDILCLGVVFEGGKDFLFSGTTYYFVISSIA